MIISKLRKEYHHRLCKEIIRVKREERGKKEYPNFADGSNLSSVRIAAGIIKRLQYTKNYAAVKEQTVGDHFETITKEFLESAFRFLDHVRPGKWHYSTVQTDISGYDQYEHLAYIKGIIEKDKRLSSALGGNYIVKPDIIVAREPVGDKEINRKKNLVGSSDVAATLTPFRRTNLFQQESLPSLLGLAISIAYTILL